MEQEKHWRKSSYSNGAAAGECVELGMLPGVILLRDTKDEGRGLEIPVTPAEWRSFIGKVKGGFLPV